MPLDIIYFQVRCLQHAIRHEMALRYRVSASITWAREIRAAIVQLAEEGF